MTGKAHFTEEEKDTIIEQLLVEKPWNVKKFYFHRIFRRFLLTLCSIPMGLTLTMQNLGQGNNFGLLFLLLPFIALIIDIFYTKNAQDLTMSDREWVTVVVKGGGVNVEAPGFLNFFKNKIFFNLYLVIFFSLLFLIKKNLYPEFNNIFTENIMNLFFILNLVLITMNFSFYYLPNYTVFKNCDGYLRQGNRRKIMLGDVTFQRNLIQNILNYFFLFIVFIVLCIAIPFVFQSLNNNYSLKQSILLYILSILGFYFLKFNYFFYKTQALEHLLSTRFINKKA